MGGFHLKNTKGMTLVEVIVILMISSILLSIVGTLLYHSMSYFQTTANQSLEKQVIDGITSYMRNELLYASDVVVAKEKPDNTEWYELSLDVQGQLRKDEETIYSESFYMNKTVDLSIQFLNSNKITISFALLNDQHTSIYSRTTTLELLNVTNTLSDSKQIYNISYDQGNGYKIYYKKNVKQIIDDADNEDIDTDSDYEGTVYDELRCRNEEISNIDANGNNKGTWIQDADYQKGDFVEYNQVIYRAIKDIYKSKNPFDNTDQGWKQISPPYWVNHSSYEKDDVVFYEMNQKYYQALSVIHNDEHTPDSTDYLWKELTDKELEVIKENHKSPTFCSIEETPSDGELSVGGEKERCPSQEVVYGTVDIYKGSYVEYPAGSDIWYRYVGSTGPNPLTISNQSSNWAPDQPNYFWKRVDSIWIANTIYFYSDIILDPNTNLYYQRTDMTPTGSVSIYPPSVFGYGWSIGYTSIDELLENTNIEVTCKIFN